MRGFLAGLLVIGLIVAVLAAFGWIYFFNDGERAGVGVNSDEIQMESKEIVESAKDAAQRVGEAVRDVEGQDRTTVHKPPVDQ